MNSKTKVYGYYIKKPYPHQNEEEFIELSKEGMMYAQVQMICYGNSYPPSMVKWKTGSPSQRLLDFLKSWDFTKGRFFENFRSKNKNHVNP